MEEQNPYDELERERTKLLQLIDDAITNRTPIANDEGILEQSLKVDAQLLRTPIVSERIRKKQNER